MLNIVIQRKEEYDNVIKKINLGIKSKIYKKKYL